MTATQSSLSELLFPGLKEVYGSTIDQWEEEFSKYFDLEKSGMAWEDYQEMIAFGQVPKTAHGAQTTYDDPTQGHKTRIVNDKYTLGFKVTREMMDDDQYREIRSLPQALAQSVRDTVEDEAANVFNRGFNNSFTGIDGQPLFSTAHTYGNGQTYANRPATDADLSMTSYEQMTLDLAALTDGRGKQMKVMPKMLIVSTAFAATAKQILQSEKDPETANNAINPFKQGVALMVGHYFTDSDAWFVRTDQKGLLCQKRVWPAEFKKDNDFDTDIAKFKTYFRLKFDWYNPRSVYGNSGGGS